MLVIFLLMLVGALIGGGATALLAARLLQRQLRVQQELLQLHASRQVSQAVNRAVTPILGTAGKLTEIVAKIQDSQSKQHDQLHKLAEFSLQMKKEMAVLTARQLADFEDESEFASGKAERPRFLN